MKYDYDLCGDCDGWKMSDCCNMPTDTDILICSACGEHCGTMCDDCVITKATENELREVK
jgi:hypothetical protein